MFLFIIYSSNLVCFPSYSIFSIPLLNTCSSFSSYFILRYYLIIYIYIIDFIILIFKISLMFDISVVFLTFNILLIVLFVNFSNSIISSSFKFYTCMAYLHNDVTITFYISIAIFTSIIILHFLLKHQLAYLHFIISSLLSFKSKILFVPINFPSHFADFFIPTSLPSMLIYDFSIFLLSFDIFN